MSKPTPTSHDLPVSFRTHLTRSYYLEHHANDQWSSLAHYHDIDYAIHQLKTIADANPQQRYRLTLVVTLHDTHAP